MAQIPINFKATKPRSSHLRSSDATFAWLFDDSIEAKGHNPVKSTDTLPSHPKSALPGDFISTCRSILQPTPKFGAGASSHASASLKRPIDQSESVGDEAAKRTKISHCISATTPSISQSATSLQHILTTNDESVQRRPIHERAYQGFEKQYPVASMTQTTHLFLRPIPFKNRRPGTLYLFTRDGDPKYVKIGMTLQSIERRMGEIRRRCSFEPQLHIVIRDVPFAARAEVMIHRELSYLGLRRIERVCRFGGTEENPGDTNKGIIDDVNGQQEEAEKSRRALCTGNHREWFEINIDGDCGARTLMDKWVRLFREAEPYDTSGVLKHEWSNVISNLPKKVASANVLLAVWSAVRRPDLPILNEAVHRQIDLTIHDAETRRKYAYHMFERNNVGWVKRSQGHTETECSRTWVEGKTGEQTSSGCLNPDHADRSCAWELASVVASFEKVSQGLLKNG